MNSKIKLILFLFILTTVLPVLGFPRSIKNTILFVIGISGIFIAFSLKRNIKTLRLKIKRFESQQINNQ